MDRFHLLWKSGVENIILLTFEKGSSKATFSCKELIATSAERKQNPQSFNNKGFYLDMFDVHSSLFTLTRKAT